jgi:2-polyprenyl-3-methyl-5-hydroxy-6-metoxy-1,4-benzoquinol methylase
MIDLRRRARDPELLDVGVEAAEAARSLADLRWVNRWLGGRRALVAGVVGNLDGPPARASLLDVGCGSADLPALLTASMGGRLLAVGVDVKETHLREAPPVVRRVVADVRALPFASGSFDVVTASLFLHHFDEEEVPSVLSALFRLCRRALVVNDLHRARVPYVFARVAFPLVFRSPVSVADGLVSIRRAFRPAELEAAFASAGIRVRIRRAFPYRIVAVAEKPA